MDRQYLCIDLKSFYASVECVERGLDPLATNLVVADPERTEKTICLAVSPSLKAQGVRNRCRVFEIPRHLEYIMAPPRMKLYIDYSADVYAVYLKYIAKEDIHVYSIDEAFMDVTKYLDLYHTSARELGERMRADVLATTGIPATCGMGTNLYLAKVALDITAKHSDDFFGYLDEDLFKETLWNHEPLTDFWRIGAGTARRLGEMGISTMAHIALFPEPQRLYDAFGVDAEILIDHAWGREPTTMADIKAYRSQSRSLTNAQVLPCAYSAAGARILVKEMVDQLCLDMVDQGLVAESVTVDLRYEKDAVGAVRSDRGTARLGTPTSSLKTVMPAVLEVYDGMVVDDARIRHIGIVANRVASADAGQLDLFADEEALAQERNRQETINSIKRRFGRNALLKGTDLLPGATQRERNRQLGGHKSGE